MEYEEVKARIQASELGSKVSYYTNLKLGGIEKRVRVEGELTGKHIREKEVINIEVLPESIMLLSKGGKETPYQGKLELISSTLREINDYRVL